MTDKYVLYTGDELTTVSLWVREGGKEYPIYANTRGRSEWYSHEIDVFENTSAEPLSDTLKEWLASAHKVRSDEIDASPWRVEPDEEPEAWYEVELFNAVNNPGMTPEQADLLEWAYEEVDG